MQIFPKNCRKGEFGYCIPARFMVFTAPRGTAPRRAIRSGSLTIKSGIAHMGRGLSRKETLPMLKIDKNVPMPTKGPGSGPRDAFARYELDNMEIGDSFAINYETDDEVISLQTVKNCARKRGWRISWRTIDKATMRYWRIA